MIRRPPRSTLFPYRTLSQSLLEGQSAQTVREQVMEAVRRAFRPEFLNRLDEIILFNRLGRAEMKRIVDIQLQHLQKQLAERDRQSTRLNSSHSQISYAVFCL